MKFISFIFWPDGRLAATRGTELLYTSPPSPCIVQVPGDASVSLIIKHIGVMETDGGNVCPSELLLDALESHPDSTPDDLKVQIKPGYEELVATITPCPCCEVDLIAFVEQNGRGQLPERVRAYISLISPELAKELGLNVGISLLHKIAAEKKRHLVHKPQSRLPDLMREYEADKASRRRRVFEMREARLNSTIETEAA